MIDVRTAVAVNVPAIQRVARAPWHAAHGDFVTDPAIEKGIAVLARLYVLPDRWGKGVGAGLLGTAIGRLRERGSGARR